MSEKKYPTTDSLCDVGAELFRLGKKRKADLGRLLMLSYWLGWGSCRRRSSVSTSMTFEQELDNNSRASAIDASVRDVRSRKGKVAK